MKRIEVAVGLVKRDREILICRRKPTGAFAGLWEFPGGKCEPGESPVDCVVRELREELAIEVQTGEALAPVAHLYPTIHVNVHPIFCSLVSGEPSPIECDRVEWVRIASLGEYTFPEANRPLIKFLMETAP